MTSPVAPRSLSPIDLARISVQQRVRARTQARAAPSRSRA